MGALDSNGSIQGTTKSQCKSSFGTSIFWQGGPASFIIHAEREAAVLQSHTTRLWRSCQLDHQPDGKIRNRTRRRFHRASASGAQSLYSESCLNIAFFIYLLWMLQWKWLFIIITPSAGNGADEKVKCSKKRSSFCTSAPEEDCKDIKREHGRPYSTKQEPLVEQVDSQGGTKTVNTKLYETL